MFIKRIFKYPFKVEDFVAIEMPKKAHVLTVQAQGDVPCIWAVVNSDEEIETRCFRCYGTGQVLDIDITSSRYIGTFQLLSGQFIGHLFES